MTTPDQASVPKRLMIIEDSADYRALLTKLFSRHGYIVECASNGKEALSQLTDSVQLPNLILLDLMMPIMDGFEFREKQIQESRFSKIPTILMTAHGDLKTAKEKLGAIEYVRKPVEMTELLALVSRCA